MEAELGDDAEQEDQLCVFISEIEKGGMAYHQGKSFSSKNFIIDGKNIDISLPYTFCQ